MPRDPSPFVDVSARLAKAEGLAPVTPHITVVGSFEEEDVVFSPFEVTLVALADSDAPYRCITLAAAPHPLLPDGAHLSLLYGDVSAERRAVLCEEVDIELPMTITIDAFALWDTSADDHTAWVEVRRFA